MGLMDGLPPRAMGLDNNFSEVFLRNENCLHRPRACHSWIYCAVDADEWICFACLSTCAIHCSCIDLYHSNALLRTLILPLHSSLSGFIIISFFPIPSNLPSFPLHALVGTLVRISRIFQNMILAIRLRDIYLIVSHLLHSIFFFYLRSFHACSKPFLPCSSLGP